jgi:hypothetical protein
MSSVKKQNNDKASNNISHQLPSLTVQNKIEENKNQSLINENVRIKEIPNPKSQKQLKLIQHKQVRAVPGQS